MEPWVGAKPELRAKTPYEIGNGLAQSCERILEEEKPHEDNVFARVGT
jgi:hypothetical protein